jgi:hypothetical protein
MKLGRRSRRQSARRRVRRHDAGATQAAPSATVSHAEAGFGPSVPAHRGLPPFAPHHLPPPLPSRHAPRDHGPAAPTMSQPPNHVAAVSGSHAPPYRAPFRGRVGTCSPRHTRIYKGQKLAGHARCAVAQSRAAPPWRRRQASVPTFFPSRPHL